MPVFPTATVLTADCPSMTGPNSTAVGALRTGEPTAATPLPETPAAVPPPAEPGQMSLPLGSGLDRRLLEELRRDLMCLRNSLTSAP